MKHTITKILLFISLFSIASAFQSVAAAELKLEITVSKSAQCAEICANVVGSPPCRHAYFLYKRTPPICRLTSDVKPLSLIKDRRAVWSREKWDRTRRTGWMDASDYRKGPAGGLPEGSYIVQMSGSGWFKGRRGKATQSSGYEYVFFALRKSTKKPELRGVWWYFPLGYDAAAVFKRLRAYFDQTRAACKKVRVTGTKPWRPHIWKNGPRFKILHGPYSGKTADTPMKFGKRGKPNNDPDSRSQWKHNYTSDKSAKAHCKSLGVPYN